MEPKAKKLEGESQFAKRLVTGLAAERSFNPFKAHCQSLSTAPWKTPRVSGVVTISASVPR